MVLPLSAMLRSCALLMTPLFHAIAQEDAASCSSSSKTLHLAQVRTEVMRGAPGSESSDIMVPHSMCDQPPCTEDPTAFDADGDNFISREEAGVEQAQWDEILRLADSDRDGKLNPTEFDALEEHIENETFASNRELSAKLEEELASGDDTGILDDAAQRSSGADFALLAAQMSTDLTAGHFAVFDRNTDGAVDKNEARLHGDDEDWANSLEKYDANADGVLSHAEFEVLLSERSSALMESSLRNVSHVSKTEPSGCRNEIAVSPDFAEAAHVARLEQLRLLSLKADMEQGWDTMEKREKALQKFFENADADGSGLLTQREYAKSGSHARFEQIQGPLRKAIDLDGDGHLLERETSAAAAFEFHVLDRDQDSAVALREMQEMFAGKGWLGKQKFRRAMALASEQTLPGLVAALLELSWSDAPQAELEHDLPAFQRAEPSAWNVSLLQLSRPTSNRRQLSVEDSQALASTIGNTALASLTDLLSQDFCWRRSYDRGVGEPAGCSSKYEARGAMCYPKCGRGRSRSNGDIEFCNKPCPRGTTDIGLHCRTNGHTKSKSCCGRCWPNKWCCRTWCCGGCPAGHKNTGCFCEPSWVQQDRKYSPGKTKYDKGVVGCPNPRFPDGPKQTPLGYFCYPKPRDGYQCDLTACREKCPALLQPCGLGACAASGAGCGTTVFQMTFDTAMAVVDTALLVASFGTSSAGASQGKRVAVKKSTQSTFRAAAKANLRTFQKKLRNAATKNTIKKVIAEKVTKQVTKRVLKDALAEHGPAFVEGAVGAIISEFLAKQGSDIKNFDYTSLDPTGVSGAVKAAIDGESSLTQARAWTEVVGSVDPTGWVAAAAAFMHPTCQR